MKMIVKKRSPEEIAKFYRRNLHKVKLEYSSKTLKRRVKDLVTEFDKNHKKK